jgi:hypothetical protein
MTNLVDHVDLWECEVLKSLGVEVFSESCSLQLCIMEGKHC